MISWDEWPRMFLPVLLLAAVWTACVVDLHQRRIPNVLTLGAAGLGVTMQFTFGGMTGVVTAITGLAVGLMILMPGYLVRTTGAGDVKLMAAVGTFLGPLWIVLAGLLSLFTGALIAAGFAASTLLTKSVQSPWQRYGFMLRSLITTGRVFYVPPEQGEVMGRKFPFAVAIAIGTTITLILWWPEHGGQG